MVYLGEFLAGFAIIDVKDKDICWFPEYLNLIVETNHSANEKLVSSDIFTWNLWQTPSFLWYSFHFLSWPGDSHYNFAGFAGSYVVSS